MQLRTDRAWCLTAVTVAVIAANLTADHPAAASPTPGTPAPQPLAETTSLTISVSSKAEGFLTFLMAEQMGEFQQENLDVDIQVVPAGDSVALVAQGHLDATISSLAAGNLNLIADGLEFRAVFPAAGDPPENKQGYWVNKDVFGEDGVFQAADLAGEAILAPTGPSSTSNPFLFLDLEEDWGGGLTPEDVTFERLADTSQVPIALINGSYMAAYVQSPFWLDVEASGCCEFIGGQPAETFSYVWFGPALINDDAAVGEAFLRALLRTNRTYLAGDYHSDPALLDDVATAMEAPPDVIQALPSRTWELIGELPTTNLDIVQTYYLDVGDLLSYTDPLTADQVFDSSWIDAVVADE